MSSTRAKRSLAAPTEMPRLDRSRRRYDTLSKIKQAILAGLNEHDQTAGEMLWRSLSGSVLASVRDTALRELQRENRIESYVARDPHRPFQALTVYRLIPPGPASKVG